MPDRRSTPPRPVPATIDAHRVSVPSRGAAAGRSTVAPAAPAVHAPARRPGAGADAERLERTVDALRRLQATLAGAQQALDAVIAEVRGAVGGAARSRDEGPAALGAAPPPLASPTLGAARAPVRERR